MVSALIRCYRGNLRGEYRKSCKYALFLSAELASDLSYQTEVLECSLLKCLHDHIAQASVPIHEEHLACRGEDEIVDSRIDGIP